MSEIIQKLFEPIGEVAKLPSKGFYGGPKQVTVRGFLTKDEKEWLKIDPDNPSHGLRTLAKNVVTEPVNFTYNNLIDADIVAILLVSKALTYGDTIIATLKCPYCETIQKTKINITNFPMKFHKNIKLPLTIKLPKSGLTIKYKLLSIGDVIKIENSEKEFQKIVGIDRPDYNEHKIIASMIVNVIDKNGNVIDLDVFEKTEFVENISKLDMEIWLEHREKYSCGPDFQVKLKCEECEQESTQVIIVGYDFFYNRKEEVFGYWNN